MICFPLDNTEYTARDLGAYTATRTRGVFSAEGCFAVSHNEGMGLLVGAGTAWVKMNEQWGCVLAAETATAVEVAVGHAALPRIDAVCLRLNKNRNAGEVVVKQGEAAVAPAMPALARDNDYDELFLATVLVPAGCVELGAANITDQRLNEAVCGLMRDGVSGIPTAQLHGQAQALMAMVADELARLNAGTEAMTKTEYAPEASAALDGEGRLVVESVHSHPQTGYEVRFTAPAAYHPDVPLVIDGSPMAAVRDSENEPLWPGAWAAGVPVSLTRREDVAFFKSGGTGTFYIHTGATQPGTARINDIWLPGAAPAAGWRVDYGNPPAAANYPEGFVWLVSRQGGTYGAFNILRRNTAMAYPTIAYQKQDGAWKAIAGQTCTGTGWRRWRLEMVKAGVVQSGGGWRGGSTSGGRLGFSVPGYTIDYFSQLGTTDYTGYQTLYVANVSNQSDRSNYLSIPGAANLVFSNAALLSTSVAAVGAAGSTVTVHSYLSGGAYVSFTDMWAE